MYHQVAQVDAGFLAWHFRLVDESKAEIASIDREFRGIGREVRRKAVRRGAKPTILNDQIFTDTGSHL